MDAESELISGKSRGEWEGILTIAKQYKLLSWNKKIKAKEKNKTVAGGGKKNATVEDNLQHEKFNPKYS